MKKQKTLFAALAFLCLSFTAAVAQTVTTTTTTTTVTTTTAGGRTVVSTTADTAPSVVYEDESELYHRQPVRPQYYDRRLAPLVAIGGGVLLYDYGYHRGYRHGRRHHRRHHW